MEKKMGQKNGQEKRQKTKAEYKNISREELMQEISGQENARTEEEKEARKNAYHAYVSQSSNPQATMAAEEESRGSPLSGAKSISQQGIMSSGRRER